jgi:hypothetical protein
MLDIFNNDAFSVTNLTDAVNALAFVPGRIGEMGLFAESGVNTTSILIEEKDGILSLVAPSPRGGAGQTIEKGARRARPLSVPHFEINDAIMAEEVQGVRAWGQETALMQIQDRVAERAMIHSQSMEATQEYSRIGAIKGIITYADATTMNLFTEFGVSQEAEVDFDLDNANPTDGVLRKKCAGVTRTVANHLAGLPFSGVRAFCGDNFFDDLLAHKEVRSTFLNWPAAQILREGYIEPNGKSYGAFEFGGIVWENYRGAVGSQAFIDADKCHIYPVGVPGLFRTVYSPADYSETTNTLGQRLYAKQYPMPNGKGVHFDVQMNALEYCTRPKVLIKGKRS